MLYLLAALLKLLRSINLIISLYFSSRISFSLSSNNISSIKYSIQADGSVLLSKLTEEEADPVLGDFLAFLENDIKKNPAKLQPLGEELRSNVSSLIAGVEFDLDAPLSDEDE